MSWGTNIQDTARFNRSYYVDCYEFEVVFSRDYEQAVLYMLWVWIPSSLFTFFTVFAGSHAHSKRLASVQGSALYLATAFAVVSYLSSLLGLTPPSLTSFYVLLTLDLSALIAFAAISLWTYLRTVRPLGGI